MSQFKYANVIRLSMYRHYASRDHFLLNTYSHHKPLKLLIDRIPNFDRVAYVFTTTFE